MLIPASVPIVILTHSHEHDRDVLENILKFATGYVGMIGSSRKVRTIFELLIEKGVEKEKLEQVHSPIGLDIAALTPQEIALSIMAEIVLYIRKTTIPRGKQVVEKIEK